VHYQGLSNIEAAAALELSVDAVESLLARARRGLRAALLPEREDLLGE
jgi:RNA polymerase sigma-70 factor (ECF subfamily)